MKNIIKYWIENEATDDEIIQLVTEVHSWNGSLEEYTFYDMEELNEIFYGVKPTEFLEKLSDDFDVKDEGYRVTIYDLESCSKEDAVDEIKNNTDEVVDAIVGAMKETNLYLPESLQELLDE